MATNEINIERFFLILKMHTRLILGVLAATLFITAAVTYQMPKMYMSTASLNFDFSANNPVDDRGRSVLSEDSYLTTQVGILESLNVAQEVVDNLSSYERKRVIASLEAGRSSIDKFIYSVRNFFKFDDDEEPAAGGGEGVAAGQTESLTPHKPYDWLAQAIRGNLLITPQMNSRIVEVSYFSTDPRIAALMADKFARAYIDTNLKMVIDPARKTKVWFDEQLKVLRNNLETAQAKLTAYQQKEGIVSSDERIDIESTKLRGLADQLVAAQEGTRNAESENRKLQEVLDRGASLETFEPVFSNAVVQKLKTDIRAIQGQLAEYSNSLGANHPRIKRLHGELSAARVRLNNEIKTITDGIQNAADLSREREKSLEEAMDRQKALVLKLKNEHDKIAVLLRDVDSAQAAYNAALNQLNTTSMQSMVDQTNVSIIDKASIPRNHATPRVSQNLALGFLGGLILGVGIALFMEIFIRRVHSEDDLMGEVGVPLLGYVRKLEA